MRNYYILLGEESIEIKTYEIKNGIVRIWGDFSENMISKENIISIRFGQEVFPRYINIILGIMLILIGFFSPILGGLLHPVISIGAFFSVIFGFIALIRKLKPIENNIRAYRLLGVLLIIVGLLPIFG